MHLIRQIERGAEETLDCRHDVERVQIRRFIFFFPRDFFRTFVRTVAVGDHFKDDDVVALEDFVERVVVGFLGDVDRADEIDLHVAFDAFAVLVFAGETYDRGFHSNRRAVPISESSPRRAEFFRVFD